MIKILFSKIIDLVVLYFLGRKSNISEINKKNINVFVVDCWLLAENNCLVREVYITLGRQQLASSD